MKVADPGKTLVYVSFVSIDNENETTLCRSCERLRLDESDSEGD